jgi:dihydrofolate reductase
MTKRRNVIVHIATSADGYIARPDGDLEWLTSRPAPEGFYPGLRTERLLKEPRALSKLC